MANDSIPDRGPYLDAVNIGFMVTAVCAAALRCVVRIGMVRNFGVDDWLMTCATGTFVCYCAFSMTGVHYGTGRHESDLTYENITKAMHYWWFCYLFYSLTMIACKISIGWFLLRITAQRIHTWIIYIAMLLSVVTGLVFFFVSFFQCHPIDKFWDRRKDGTCVNAGIIVALAQLYSVFSVISDFTFAILPAFIIWNLKMAIRTKVTLIPLVAMGCVASAAVVARIPYLATFKDPDYLWATLDIAVWSSVEQGLAITAGSLATLRPLLRLIYHRAGFYTNRPSHGPSKWPGAPSGPHSGVLSPRGTRNTGHARGGSEPAADILSFSNLSKNSRSIESSWARREKGSPNESDGFELQLSPPIGSKDILVTQSWDCRSERRPSVTGPLTGSEAEIMALPEPLDDDLERNHTRLSDEAVEGNRKGPRSFLANHD